MVMLRGSLVGIAVGLLAGVVIANLTLGRGVPQATAEEPPQADFFVDLIQFTLPTPITVDTLATGQGFAEYGNNGPASPVDGTLTFILDQLDQPEDCLHDQELTFSLPELRKPPTQQGRGSSLGIRCLAVGVKTFQLTASVTPLVTSDTQVPVEDPDTSNNVESAIFQVVVVDGDADGDGVLDAEDACAATPGLAELDGCPASFLVIDGDSIDNGTPPNFFSNGDMNDDIAAVGQRAQLRFFTANVGGTITLHTGQVGDEGWFALKTIPASWAAAGPADDGLRNYLLAGPGLGSPNAGGNLESLLDKVPDVTPLRATGLKLLQGQGACAVVFDGDINIGYDSLNGGLLEGSLKGANLGTVAFKVISVTQSTGFSSASLPKVEIRILDADQICPGPRELFTDAPDPISSSEPLDVVP